MPNHDSSTVEKSPAGAHNLPATVELAFAPGADEKSAQAATWDLAHSHYENFTVVSFFVPRHLRQDFSNIYAFCRLADDLGDELGDRAKSLEYLARFREEVAECYAGRPRAVIFHALAGTIRRHHIPAQPFLDLIDAFEQDQRIDRYENFAQVLDYCRRSADPVGRLVLYLCGYTDQHRQQLSDKTCTALQLTNFWQDVRRDFVDRDRIYLPADSMQQFGVTVEQIRGGRCDDNYRALIRFEVDRAQALFNQGKALLPMLAPSFRRQVALFGKGGLAILQAIRRQNYDTLTRRPALSKWRKGRLILSMLADYASRSLPFGVRE